MSGLTKVKATYTSTANLYSMATTDSRGFTFAVQDTNTPVQPVSYTCQLQATAGLGVAAITGSSITNLNPTSPIGNASTATTVIGTLQLTGVAAGSYILHCEDYDTYSTHINRRAVNQCLCNRSNPYTINKNPALE